MTSLILSSFMAVVAGFIGNAYETLAKKRGWPIGKLFQNRSRLIGFISLIAILGGAIQLIFLVKLWYGLLLVFAAFVTATALTLVFKKNAQTSFFILIVLSVLIWIVGGAEIVSQ